MATQSVEEIKTESRGLRGHIADDLSSGATHFEEDSFQLMKFHGSYQQDDRDQRNERRKAGLEKAWQFMIRSKIPGGALNSAQYLMHDRMADELAGHTIRLTTRQGIQMHGVLFGNLKECIRRINESGLTTWGACGDIVRNTTASPAPFSDAVHTEAQDLAGEISRTFYARSRGYSEIWLDAEKLPIEPQEINDPIYATALLPRKFKFGIVVPPRNDVDVFTNDVGLVACVENGAITGYNLYAGGSFGMSYGQMQTRPAIAQPLFYVDKQHVIETLKAIVEVQRVHGRRDDRKQARLKYLIIAKGIDWLRDQVLALLTTPTSPLRPVQFDTVEDLLGWHAQGDGKLFCGVWIADGRIRDTALVACRTALRRICETYAPGLRITPNCNILLCDIAPENKAAIEQILREAGVVDPASLTRSRRVSHACVALPTCGLALAESERVFSGLMDSIDTTLRELGLAEEPILFRMSGCPNGCSRPYNADFAFVGRSPGKYALYVGGSHRGDRLAGLHQKTILLEDLPKTIRTYLEDYVANRLDQETFTDYWGRTQTPGEEPSSEQFHIELKERAERLQPA